MINLVWLCPETNRLLRLLYDEEEFWELIYDLKDSDGWLIIPFNEVPVFEKVKPNIIRAYNWRLN